MRWVETALRDGAVLVRDERGLMPLPEARTLLARRRVFAKGEATMIEGQSVLHADRLWAALLSLEDAEEFVRVASRLRWEHPPRGRDNAAPVERYGDGVLPWLEGALGPDGRFPPNLWCAAPSLLRVGGERALDLALKVRRSGFLAEWLDAHPEGFTILADRAQAGDGVAAKALGTFGAEDPGALRAALGDRVGALGLPELSAAVREALAAAPPQPGARGRALSMSRVSACVRNFELPMWDNANYFTGAMRVSAFASPVADALVFQSLLTGLGMGNLRLEIARVDADGLHRVLEREILAEEELYRWDGDELVCVPTGARRRGRELLSPPARAPRVWVDAVGEELPCEVDVQGMNEAVARVFGRRSVEEGLLARLGQQCREKLFLSGDALRAAAGLDEGAIPLFAFDGFQTPLAGEPATAAPDLVAMVEALRERRALARLPVGGHPLGNLYDRFTVPGLAWGDPAMAWS